MAERSLSLRASGDHLLIWNEMEATFILLHRNGDVMEELSRVTSRLSDTYILHLQPPHFLTESGTGVHLWKLDETSAPSHSLDLDTFGLELGVIFHPFCALTMSTNVANWHDGWTVQVTNQTFTSFCSIHLRIVHISPQTTQSLWSCFPHNIIFQALSTRKQSTVFTIVNFVRFGILRRTNVSEDSLALAISLMSGQM